MAIVIEPPPSFRIKCPHCLALVQYTRVETFRKIVGGGKNTRLYDQCLKCPACRRDFSVR